MSADRPAPPPPPDWDAFPAYWTEVLASQEAAFPWPPPHLIQILHQVVSTNQSLWERLAQGDPVGTTVIAQRQTAGRGQWGRSWASAEGGLYLSWSCAPHVRAELAAQLTLCSAWGIATSLQAWGIPVQIKWPNDLVLKGRKLGGMLTETRLRGEGVQQAVIGVGINWANPVPETGISLHQFWADRGTAEMVTDGETAGTAIPQDLDGGVPPIASLAHLAAIVLQGVITGYGHWQQQGIGPILPAYEALLSHRDRPIDVGGERWAIVGITPTGNLRVRRLTTELAGTDITAGTAMTDIGIIDRTDRHREVEQILRPGQIRLGYDVNDP